MPPNLLYDFIVNIDDSALDEALIGIEGSEIEAVASVFRDNLESIRQMVLLPVMLYAREVPLQAQLKVKAQAAKKELDELYPAGADEVTTQAFLAQKSQEIFQRGMTVEEAEQAANESIASFINFLGREKGESSRQGMYQVIASVAISLWATFEALVGDALIIITNARPRYSIGKLIDSQLTVQVGDLIKYDFDLRQHFGDILKPKDDYRTMAQIKRDYQKLFKGRIKIIDEVFNDPRLQYLEQLRHLLVHRAGIRDDKYVKIGVVKEFDPSAKVGERLILKGAVATELGRGVAESGSKLLLFLNEWLKSVDR